MLIDDGKIIYEGIEKAAILVMSLPFEQSGKLLAMLNDEELVELSRTMSVLGPVNSRAIDSLCMDFVREFATNGFLLGSKENTQKFLSQVLPEDKYHHIIADMSTPPGKSEPTYRRAVSLDEKKFEWSPAGPLSSQSLCNP